MRVLIFIWYLLILLLDFGNTYCSGLQQHADRGISGRTLQGTHFAAFIEQAETLNLSEDEFPYLLEENTSAGNEDDNDDQCSPGATIPDQGAVSFPGLLVQVNKCPALSSWQGNAMPIYLSIRVLRI